MKVEGVDAPEVHGFVVERAYGVEEDGVSTVVLVMFEVGVIHDGHACHAALPIALPLDVCDELISALVAKRIEVEQIEDSG